MVRARDEASDGDFRRVCRGGWLVEEGVRSSTVAFELCFALRLHIWVAGGPPAGNGRCFSKIPHYSSVIQPTWSHRKYLNNVLERAS